MKTLLFLRHGKSDWEAAWTHDHERPLKKRGRKDAERMGRFITAAGLAPDRILTSTAVRARQTLEIAQKAGEWGAPVRETSALYMADVQTVLNEVRREPDDAEVLLLVGHEPTWSTAVSRLIDGGDLRYPTAAVAAVSFEADRWREVAFGDGELAWFLPPKVIKRALKAL